MAAFQQENMIYVAGATAQFATTYDGTDPQDGLNNLYYFLRAGYVSVQLEHDSPEVKIRTWKKELS